MSKVISSAIIAVIALIFPAVRDFLGSASLVAHWALAVSSVLVLALGVFIGYRLRKGTAPTADSSTQLSSQASPIESATLPEPARVMLPRDNHPFTDPWTMELPATLPLSRVFLRTSTDSEADLMERLEVARQKITVFGLTRNFYSHDKVRPLIEKRAKDIPVSLFLMDPDCPAREQRYKIEGREAAFADPKKMKDEIIDPLRTTIRNVRSDPAAKGSFNAIEEIDSTIRVMLYGHNQRGTDGPIFVFRRGNPYFDYFSNQVQWLEKMAHEGVREPYSTRGIVLTPLIP